MSRWSRDVQRRGSCPSRFWCSGVAPPSSKCRFGFAWCGGGVVGHCARTPAPGSHAEAVRTGSAELNCDRRASTHFARHWVRDHCERPHPTQANTHPPSSLSRGEASCAVPDAPAPQLANHPGPMRSGATPRRQKRSQSKPHPNGAFTPEPSANGGSRTSQPAPKPITPSTPAPTPRPPQRQGNGARGLAPARRSRLSLQAFRNSPPIFSTSASNRFRKRCSSLSVSVFDPDCSSTW